MALADYSLRILFVRLFNRSQIPWQAWTVPDPRTEVSVWIMHTTFFVLIFVWVLIVPVKGSSDSSVRVRSLQIGVAVAAVLVQLFFAVQFLRELWSATWVDQVRTMMRMLIYAGLSLYLFLVVKTLLPRTILNIEALTARKHRN